MLYIAFRLSTYSCVPVHVAIASFQGSPGNATESNSGLTKKTITGSGKVDVNCKSQ